MLETSKLNANAGFSDDHCLHIYQGKIRPEQLEIPFGLFVPDILMGILLPIPPCRPSVSADWLDEIHLPATMLCLVGLCEILKISKKLYMKPPLRIPICEKAKNL